MPTKITVIYDNPEDAQAFESGYAAQPGLARALPGIQRLETSKVWPKEDGSPTPAYRLVDMYFPDYATASAAVASEQAQAFFGNVMQVGADRLRIVFADIEES